MAFSNTKYGDRIQLALNRTMDRERHWLGARGIEDLEILSRVLPSLRVGATTSPTFITFTEDPDRKQFTALLVALIQYPVHMYSISILYL